MYKTPIALCGLIAVASSLAAQQPDRTFTVPGTTVQVAVGSDAARVSRDGGRTWRPLVAPDTTIYLRHGRFDPLDGVRVPAGFEAPSNTRLHLVQLHTQMLEEYREVMTRLGADLRQYLPEQTFVVRADPSVVPALQALPFVRWVGPYHTFFRLDPALVEDLQSREVGDHRYVIALVDRFRDAPALEARIEDAGGHVDIHGTPGSLILEATMSWRQLMVAADADQTLFIQRATPIEFDMDNVRIQAGTNYVQGFGALPDSRSGEGVRAHIMEGIYPTHPEHAAQPPYRTTPIGVASTGPDSHGNSTASIVAARGAQAAAKGNMPYAQLLFTNYTYVYNNNNRYALTQQLVDPSGTYHAMMQTASWGYARTLIYDARSAEMDTILLDFPIWITQSQSNAGATAQPRDSRPQAWSKSIASIGGFYHYDNASPADDCWCRSGSTGPATDGRIGVSFAAYYDRTYAASGSTTYTQFGGTSGATPIVNGLGGIAIQMFTMGDFGYPAAATWQDRWMHNPKNMTVKALLAATTRQLPLSASTRVQQGWGFPHVGDLYDRRDRLLVIDELDVLTQQNSSRTYYVFVDGNDEFRAAMMYTDPPAAPNAAIHRINSLDLHVRDATGTEYWGNNGLMTSLTSTAGGVANDRDTEEMVILSQPPAGAYEVTVRATNIATDARPETRTVDADFGLVVRGLAGMRDASSNMALDLESNAPGDFRVSLSNVPNGYVGGFVFYSINTTRPIATGNLFGVEADFLSLASLSIPPQAGNPFSFAATTNGALFPNATFAFPAGLAMAVQGLEFDAVAIAYNRAAQVIGASNVDRVTIQ